MRKAALGAVAVGVSTLLLSPVQASAIDNVNSTKLREAVTVGGILKHERALQRIADQNNGTRASGTSGYNDSANYVYKKLKAAGYKVSKQHFNFPYYAENAPATLATVTPTPEVLETSALSYSGSGDVTGVIVPTTDIQVPPGATPSSTSGCEAADFPTAPAGPAIALIQRGTCNLEIKAQNATAAGYEAAIIFNEGQVGRTALFNATLTNIQTIPVVAVSFETGADLYAAATAGVTARITTDIEYDPSRRTLNVLAETPKGKKSDETVVVGAHLDSVTEGPGINDNGSGSAAILEIAEEMAELKYTKKGKLQRQVRFAFWGAEESGLLGAQHYVDNLSPAQLSGIYANLNFDMLGSPNYVRFVYDGDGSDTPLAGPAGSGAIEDVFNDYFEGEGLATAPTEFSGRSDYGPFIAKGIPAGGLFSGAEGVKTQEQADVFGGTAGEAYDPCYHQACDDINNLNQKALFELGDAAAHATFALATSRSGLLIDGSRVKAKAQAKATAAKSDHVGHQLTR